MPSERSLPRCQQFKSYDALVPSAGDSDICAIATIERVDEDTVRILEQCYRTLTRAADGTIRATGSCAIGHNYCILPNQQV